MVSCIVLQYTQTYPTQNTVLQKEANLKVDDHEATIAFDVGEVGEGSSHGQAPDQLLMVAYCDMPCVVGQFMVVTLHVGLHVQPAIHLAVGVVQLQVECGQKLDLSTKERRLKHFWTL